MPSSLRFLRRRRRRRRVVCLLLLLRVSDERFCAAQLRLTDAAACVVLFGLFLLRSPFALFLSVNNSNSRLPSFFPSVFPPSLSDVESSFNKLVTQPIEREREREREHALCSLHSSKKMARRCVGGPRLRACLVTAPLFSGPTFAFAHVIRDLCDQSREPRVLPTSSPPCQSLLVFSTSVGPTNKHVRSARAGLLLDPKKFLLSTRSA